MCLVHREGTRQLPRLGLRGQGELPAALTGLQKGAMVPLADRHISRVLLLLLMLLLLLLLLLHCVWQPPQL